MVAAKTKFDGKLIETPRELIGSPPGEVIVLYIEAKASGPSIWDVIGKSPNPMTASQIDNILAEEKASWHND